MSKKRVYEIAKEQGLSSKELLERLTAAGVDVKAAASAVDEALALKALAPDGAARSGDADGAPAPGPGAPASARPPQAPAAASGPAAPAVERVRPTRDSRTGERTPGEIGPGGRRRVVIDSQASRRQQGGPANLPQRRPRRGRRRRGTYDETIAPIDTAAMEATDLIRVNSGSTVKDVAEYLGVAVPEVIKKLMTLGEMATLTQTLSDDAIQVLADEFDKKIEIVHAADDAAGEPGGITQHIGAYQVHHGEKDITFLDTPGHEAFTAMRARGARVTDLAVIVVAADDGVKPQTEEAIDHARAAEVPVVVAVNKVDKEGAQPERVRTEMTQHGLQPSEWGGEIEFVDVSAKTRQGLDGLLDTIQLVTDLEELRRSEERRGGKE